jgi:hypothetical protein
MVSGQFFAATALVVLMAGLMLRQAAPVQDAANIRAAVLPAGDRPRSMIGQANGGFVITDHGSSPAPIPSPPVRLGQSVHIDRRLVDGPPQARSTRHATSRTNHDAR